jgi:retinol-binding protein 3
MQPSTLRVFCLGLLLALATGTAAQTQITLPDTPAGDTFKAFLAAFNSGDQAQIDAFCRTYADSSNPSAMTSPDILMQFRNVAGGFDLLQIVTSEPRYLETLVRDRTNHKFVVILVVEQGNPAKVADMQFIIPPPGVSVSELKVTLDSAEKTRVINGVIAKLNADYVSSDLAKQMEDAIRTRQKKGQFAPVTDGFTFAAMLTTDLRDVSHDKHLRVNFSPTPLPEQNRDAAPSPQQLAAERQQLEQANCGFQKLEILPRNIGYVKFSMFADPDICGPTAIAAMNFVANSDAVIFDLRGNGGGDPRMVALLCSYLFRGPTHLNDLWERKTASTHQWWTLGYVPGKRLDTQPVFVLTSSSTFSGAEEFTYDLQELKRATVVGETTEGGAHLVRGERIDAHFMIGVPFAKAINPISKTNWEGTGVIPDVKVPAAEALSTAEKLAAQKLTVTH